jgi:salicylate hydroxylase
MIGWKGSRITSLDFIESAQKYGAPFWDFHRADLHNCLYRRALELGAKVHTNCRVVEVEYQTGQSTVVLASGKRHTADLVVGADGIVSRTRECFLGRVDPPTPTGDLAYRVLLDLHSVQLDDDVQEMLKEKEVNYWMGPGAHAVCYQLRNSRYLNSKPLLPVHCWSAAKNISGSSRAR